MRNRSDLWYLPPIPEEVMGWNDRLIEMFCVLSMKHLCRGFSPAEADEKAIRQVKAETRFNERSDSRDTCDSN